MTAGLRAPVESNLIVELSVSKADRGIHTLKYVVIQAFDCPDAWYKVLHEIWGKGDSFEVGYGSERSKTKKLNLSIEITHPEIRPLVDDRAPCDMKYVNWYALKYLWSGGGRDVYVW